MRVNVHKRLVTVKIVYYGPGMSGKTTNLRQLHAEFPQENRGAMLQLDTETERTLFFDYFPAVLGRLGNFRVKVDFFTVPGQSFYHSTRRAVLESADGVVFVADSNADREEANLQSREDMVEALKRTGSSLEEIPHVYQWNKRDHPNALPVTLLESLLNPEGEQSFEAVAIKGEGVWETHSAILKLVFDALKRRATEARVG